MYKFTGKDNDIFAVQWSHRPRPVFAGAQEKEPMYVYASATTPEITLDFYAYHSNSFPFGSKSGLWENLIPTWKFCDASGNAIESVTLKYWYTVPSCRNGTESYQGSNASNPKKTLYKYKYPIWYVDQRASSHRDPIYLWVTMNLSAMGIAGETGNHLAYVNSNACAITRTKVSSFFPDVVRYTIDGKRALSSEYHWTDTEIPFVGTAHSTNYDSEYYKRDVMDPGNGIVYDFPISDEIRIPFNSVVWTSMSALSAETQDHKMVLGKPALDDEGLPVPIIETTGYLYSRVPVTAYEKDLGSSATTYLETSSRENLVYVPDATQYAIPETDVVYTAPAFNKYDDRTGDHFYIGGYFVGNVTMPDTARTSGESFRGEAKMDPGASAYFAHYASWVSAPHDGVLYRIFPTWEGLSEDQKNELRRRGYPIPNDEGAWELAPESASAINIQGLVMSGGTGSGTFPLTSSQSAMRSAGFSDAYHLSGVHGIYCTAIDLHYNLWGVDEEQAKLYKITPSGTLTKSWDLNTDFWNYISSKAPQQTRNEARLYFGKQTNGTWSMDLPEKSLQPSWICLSPRNGMEIYIGYHASYLVTKHNMDGNIIDCDFSNPSAFRGPIAQQTDNVQLKGFQIPADNANKPCVIAVGESDEVWVTYSSTGIGNEYENGAYVEPSEEKLNTCCKVCMFPDGKIRQADAELTYGFGYGKNIVDMCVHRSSAYILISDENDIGELVRVHRTAFGGLECLHLVGGKDSGDGLPFKTPGHLSMSMDGKCWFHGNRRDIYCYDTSDGTLYTFLSGTPYSDLITNSQRNKYINPKSVAIDGMSIDPDNYLWVIDNFATSNVIRLDADKMIELKRRSETGNVESDSIDITLPKLDNAKSNRMYPSGTYNSTGGTSWRQVWYARESDDDVPFVIANGDWTGIKMELAISNPTSALSADSGPIYLQDHKHFNFRKYNESWDTVENMKKNILVPKFRDASKQFWDEYAENMVGGVDNTSRPIGRRLYERIANLVPNLHDANDCTVMGLQSMATAQDVPLRKYDIHFPEAANRMVDLFSCKHERIWGDRCHCNSNFVETQKSARNKTHLCTSCGHWHLSNCGDKFNPSEQDLRNNDLPYLVRNPMESKSYFQKITPTKKSVEDAKLVLYKILTRQWSYADSSRFAAIPDDFAESILLAPDYNTQLMAVHTQFYIDEAWYNMCYWHFVPTECGVHNIGLVNWDDEWTTFPESLSGSEEFYDNPDPTKSRATGYAAMMFQWLLYRGLGFSLSGTST